MIRRKTYDDDKTLQLTVETWKNDSYGLFDYESAGGHAIQRFTIAGPVKIFRNWMTSDTKMACLQDIKKGILPPEDYEFLASIVQKKNSRAQTLMITAPEPVAPLKINSELIHTNSYVSIKSLRSRDGVQGYALVPGDIVRLGRLSFVVLEFRNDQKTFTFKNTDYQDKRSSNVLKVEGSSAGTCRICLGDETTPQNFLISACKCSGSCEFVHIQCLKIWIDSKIKKQSKGIATIYNFTKFECELCKGPYPITIQNGSNNVDLMTIQKPNKPYIMLESIPDKKDKEAKPVDEANPFAIEENEKLTKALYVISTDETKTVKLGRGHQSDIILDDISVSRAHAQISFRKNEFILRDMDSKFGTLVEMKRALEIKDGLRIQTGRSLYTFRYGPKIRTCNYIQ